MDGPTTRSLFDPVRLGRYERDAWAGYYRRGWSLVLSSAVGMVRIGFGLPRLTSLRAAWWVLRANRAWAPYPDNDPDSARRLMGRFYAVVRRTRGPAIDHHTAAVLEVAWWHEHRVLQRERRPDDECGSDDEAGLIEALVELYAYVNGTHPDAVRPAAVERAAAMRVCDAWVADGCRSDDPRSDEVRRRLVRPYRRLDDALAGARRVSGSERVG
jgi:hypothetical protein